MRAVVLAVLAALLGCCDMAAGNGQCQSIGLILKHAKTSRILVGAQECRKNFTNLSEFSAKPVIQFPGQPTYANYTVMFISANSTGDVNGYRLHWLVANILPIGSNLGQKGTTLAEYHPPTLPPPGKTAVYKMMVYEQKRWSPPLHHRISNNIRSHFIPKAWLRDKDNSKSIQGLYSSTQFYAYSNATPPFRFTTTVRPFHSTPAYPTQRPVPPGFHPDMVNPSPAPPGIGFRPDVVYPATPTQQPQVPGIGFVPQAPVVHVLVPPAPQTHKPPPLHIEFHTEKPVNQPPTIVHHQPIVIQPVVHQPAVPFVVPVQGGSVADPRGVVPEQPYGTVPPVLPNPPKKKKNSAGLTLPNLFLLGAASYLLVFKWRTV